MKIITVSFLLCFSLLPVYVQSQQQESQLAFKYYRDKDYEKASSLFLQLYERTFYRNYFNYFISSIINLKQYDEAEKFIKKEIKKHPEDKSFLIELGYLYKLLNKPDKMEEKYNQAIKKLIPVDRDIIDLANSFIGKREYEYAVLTYKKGRELRKISNIYHFEMANIFLFQRNFESMIKEFFDALSFDPSLLSQVQGRLQSALFQDVDHSLNDLLKNRLLQRIQKQNNNIVFNELLTWYFIQNKDFESAIRMSKSLVLRLGENDERLLDLAQLVIANNEFDHALGLYRYIIKNEPDEDDYFFARVGELNVRFVMLKNLGEIDFEKFTELENDFLNFLDEVELSYKVLPTILQLAQLQAFFMNKSFEAIALLNKAQNIKRINLQSRAQLKMVLSDIELFVGNVWEAVLLYAQIEKSNKNNPIGYEAKFKKAKAAYFMGDLKWAQAQLDVLKGSTSKFISNDAIALSQLINENTSLDSTCQAMKLFAKADFLSYQRKDSLALQTLDSIIVQYPAHSLSDEAYFKMYEIYLSVHNYPKALSALDYIVENYNYDMLADRALFQRAILYEKLQQYKKANESYKHILNKYPESIFVTESRIRFRKLQKQITK